MPVPKPANAAASPADNPSADNLWEITVCEGRPYDIMLRAALLCLALAKQHRALVHFEKKDSYAPWRHLLSAEAQLQLRLLDQVRSSQPITEMEADLHALRAFDSQASLQDWQQANDKLLRDTVQNIVLRPGSSISLNPKMHTWLFILSEMDKFEARARMHYERIFALSPVAASTHSARLEAMPLAVEQSIFKPLTTSPSPADQPALPHCLLISNGDLATTQRFIAWLRCGAQVGRITVFEPYFCVAEQHAYAVASGGISSDVAFQEACGPQARAEIYHACQMVLVASDVYRPDNHFLWEAVSCGLTPLAYLLETPAASDTQAVWSEALLRQAYAAWVAQQPVQGLPTVVDLATLTTQLLERLQQPAPLPTLAPAKIWQIGPHYVRQCLHKSHWQQPLTALLPAASAAKHSVILCPGPQAQGDADLRRALQHYAAVYFDAAYQAELIVWLVQAIKTSIQPRLVEAHRQLLTLLEGTTPCCIDVLHINDKQARMGLLDKLLLSLQQRRAAPAPSQTGAPATTMRVLLHLNKRIKSGTSQQRIGASVASETITRGLAYDAPGRYSLQWLGKQQPFGERGRFYFYPAMQATGFDQDETDYATLPTLLSSNQIDVICHVDPFLVGGVSARALWARKAIPLVGMLHSIHSSLGSSDVIFQLLSGPTFAYDALISPSACGKKAFLGLFAAASAWLAQVSQGAMTPRYEGQVHVIPYGIETSYYHGMHSGSCRAALDWPQQSIILLSLGRLHRQEKADLLPLLLSLQALVKRRQPVFLALAGANTGTQYGDELRQMVRSLGLTEHVRIIEDMSSHDKLLMYGAADIFVAPSDSIQETYGLAILEAMAAGCAVVASAWNGYSELVVHGETGFLVPTQQAEVPVDLLHVQRIAEGIGGYGHRDLHETVVVDPFAMTHFLEQLCNDAALRRRFGDAGQRRCETHYHMAQQARCMGDLLLELHAKAAAAPPPQPTPWRPFYDPIGRRFAHYSSNGFVEPTRHVRLTPWSEDAALRQQICSLMHLAPRLERQLTESLLDEVAARGSCSIAQLSEKFATAPRPNNNTAAYNGAAIMRRVVRCLKYGLLC